ncbi:hypothetical protein Tco_0953573 [Tanacetum coccineum]|uniref:Uncharacterized protein n=1 Tax=Tanacetum coccineum TaxID=301880 RepID=A0ABQ5E0P7_9ASTR
MKRIIKEQVKAQTSKIMTKVKKYVTKTLGAEVSDVQKNLYKALLKAYNFDKDLISSYGEVVTLKRGRDDQDKDEELSAGSNHGSKPQRSGKEESSKEATQKESKSTSSSKGTTRSLPKSSGKSVQEDEHDPRVDDLEEPLHQEFDIGNDDVSPIREATDVDERLWNPSGSQTPDREWNQTKTLNIQHLTQDLLTGPTYDLIKGTCKSVVELEYHLEEGKLMNLNVDEWFTLNVALGMYTRRIVIQERVEDLQLEVESYQKKINLTKPDTYRSYINKKTPYTTYHDIQSIIYQDDMIRNCLMRTDELYKFSDGTLNHVRTSLNDIATGIQMEYLLKRKWSKQDKQRTRVMIKAIGKKLKDRRLMRCLEKFVGGRPYRGDLRLLQRTI